MPKTSPNATAIVAELKKLGSKTVRDGMTRFGIPNDNAVGIPVGTLRKLGKTYGPDHDLALALWNEEMYEARMLACFVGDPKQLTAAQMDAWCRDFDSWGICDTACFHLFDKTPLAWGRIPLWAKKQAEFEKRAAFALIASLAGHDKKSGDEPFAKCLPLIHKAASDERNFVRKGVSWALRGIGHRSAALHSLAIAAAQQLAESKDLSERWVGKDALRDLQRPLVAKKVAKKKAM